MRATATVQTPVAPLAAWTPVSRGRELLLATAEQARRIFTSLRSRTDLVRDPFSPEQNRD